MNAKRLILVFSLLLILSAGVFAYLQMSAHSVEIQNLTDLLPQRALAYASVHNLDRTWSKIKFSDLYSKIIDSHLIIDNHRLESLKEKANLSWFTQKEVMAIFGKDAVLAVFFRKMISDEPEFDFILVSRIDRTSKVKELLLKSFSRIKKDVSISSAKYKGFRINSVKNKSIDEDLVYLILGDVLVWGNNIKLLEDAVDLVKNGYEDSISNDAVFRKVKEKLPDGYLGWLYFDFKKAQQLVEDLTGKAYAPEFKYNPIADYFLEFSFDEGIYVKGWAYFNFDNTQEATLFKAIRQSGGNSNGEAIKFAPLDAAMFTEGNLGDIKLIWSYVKEQVKKTIENTPPPGQKEYLRRMQQSLSDINSLLGFDIEKDLLPYLGQDYSFSFAGFEPITIPLVVIQSRAKPINLSFPEIFVSIQVTDKNKIAPLISGLWQKITEQANKQYEPLAKAQMLNKPQTEEEADEGTSSQGKERSFIVLTLETENYSGVDIHSLKLSAATYLSLGISENIFSPSYCFLDDYLVLSSNNLLLRQMVNAYEGKLLNLGDSIKFSEIRKKLHPEFNNIAYVNIGEFIDPIEGMFDSFAEVESGDTTQEEYRKNVIEIMDILKNIKAIGSTTIKKDDFMEFELYMPMEGL